VEEKSNITQLTRRGNRKVDELYQARAYNPAMPELARPAPQRIAVMQHRATCLLMFGNERTRATNSGFQALWLQSTSRFNRRLA